MAGGSVPVLEPLLGSGAPLPAGDGARARLASLDVFRGLAVVLMILVDDAGGAYPQIGHVPWDGIHVADFVMPFFLFIVGVAMALTFKRVADPKVALTKAAWRALNLTLLGMLLQGGLYQQQPGAFTLSLDFLRLRYTGILQRIAVAYFVTAVCEVAVTSQHPPPVSSVGISLGLYTRYSLHWFLALLLLLSYQSILSFTFVPTWDFKSPITGDILQVPCDCRAHLDPPCNAAAHFDRLLLGLPHMYPRPGYRRGPECSTTSPAMGPLPPDSPSWCLAPFDPEGLVSTLSAIVTCLIGIHYGHVLVHLRGHKQRLVHWVLLSTTLAAAGLAVAAAGLPLNKMIYSVSYTLLTAGISGLTFSALYLLVDVYGIRWTTLLLEWAGINALLVFVLGACGLAEAVLRAFYWGKKELNLIDILRYGAGKVFFNDGKAILLTYVLGKIVFWCLVAGACHAKGIYWKL